MDELVGRVADKVGISQDKAREAVGILFRYLSKAAPRDKMGELLRAIPEAATVAAPAAGGGMMGGMLGAMAAMGEMTALGLSMGEVQATARETIQFAREKAGDQVVDDIVASIPGISQYL